MMSDDKVLVGLICYISGAEVLQDEKKEAPAPPPKKTWNIFTSVKTFLRDILPICWQFTSTYVYQFFSGCMYLNISSNGVNFSASTHRLHRQVLSIHP